MIELVMVIVILAILGAVALPFFVDLRGEARVANEAAVVGAVRQGIQNFFLDPARGNRSNYPCDLDTVLVTPGTTEACREALPCFRSVLQGGGVTSGWTKLDSNFGCMPYTYRSSANNTNVWRYTPFNGEFRKTVD